MRKLLLILAAAFLTAGVLFADVSPWDAWRLGYTCFEQDAVTGVNIPKLSKPFRMLLTIITA